MAKPALKRAVPGDSTLTGPPRFLCAAHRGPHPACIDVRLRPEAAASHRPLWATHFAQLGELAQRPLDASPIAHRDASVQRICMSFVPLSASRLAVSRRAHLSGLRRVWGLESVELRIPPRRDQNRRSVKHPSRTTREIQNPFRESYKSIRDLAKDVASRR